MMMLMIRVFSQQVKWNEGKRDWIKVIPDLEKEREREK